MSTYLPADKGTILRQIASHVEYTLAGTRFNFDKSKAYRAVARSIRDRIIEAFNDTNAYFDEKDVKRVYYLSLEFLMGRAMQNALLNMDLEGAYEEALGEIGFRLAELYEEEQDAALGNGGLGRLAACFLDSMATLDLPAWGYGIRYNYGIFKQRIKDGAQVEVPDYWLTFGNPWEVERVDVVYPVRFYGHVVEEEGGRRRWTGGETVVAVAYDNPIPGYDTWNTINLRLWKSAPAKEFDLSHFNAGDYLRAVEARQRAETISHVLYPADNTSEGKELRLKQQYFFVAATLKDAFRRFRKVPRSWSDLPKKVAIQLNDTHPTIAIPEMMRQLVDYEGLAWEEAWEITRGVFSYTNHTILPEALEKWSVGLMNHLLPRHLEIIYDINWHFLESLRRARPGDDALASKLSVVEEGEEKRIRMAHLGILGSHAVNGVAELHTQLLKTHVFPEFHALFPTLFQNKTNGVTPRRWLNQANPRLTSLITSTLGPADMWLKNLSHLVNLRAEADKPAFQERWMAVKRANKQRLADWVKENMGIDIPVDGVLYDIQVKRIHEYKRQLLNALGVVHRYLELKSMSAEERRGQTPRIVFIGGKSAPGYAQAKRIIRFIHSIGAAINEDPDTKDYIRLLFLPNYNVSLAEVIIPASELSQHISTAGMEASGTSNMKFAMNGCLIIGTMDGANIEIAEEIGRDNMFIFGALTEEVEAVRAAHRRGEVAAPPAAFERVLAAVREGRFGGSDIVDPLLDSISGASDYYLVCHDFCAYLEAQKAVDAAYADPARWTAMSIRSTAGSGKFSTDRTIHQYATEIWGLSPCRRPAPDLMEDLSDLDATAVPDASPPARLRSKA